MGQIKHIYKGESLTILFAFPADYDMARIQSHGIWIDRTEFTGVTLDHGIELKLTSRQTDLMKGSQCVTLWIDDTILGVRKPYVGDLKVSNTNALPDNESVSQIYDVIVNIDISVTAIEVDGLLFDFMKGDKGDPLTYDQLTPEQKAELKGDKGDPMNVSSGAKTNADAGVFGQISITDDYMYICVVSGSAGSAIWKKTVLFQV